MINFSQDLLNRYIEGKASLQETAEISARLRADKNLASLVEILESLQENGMLNPEDAELPMASMAAASEGNLCDVMCEMYILKDYADAQENPECLTEALDNCWLKESGTPLHNIGRLLEKHGMTVIRKYDCSIQDIIDGLNDKRKIIAVVDYGQLWNGESDGIYHAVVCVSIADGMIRIYDPAIDGHSNYGFKQFEKAWNYSRHYIVVASTAGLGYTPHPIDVSDVTLNEDLIELTEAIAENAHEVWASKRMAEGWKYGPQRNDELLEHPDMIPYCELTEGEKYYDRALAMNTLRLVKKLGFNISRRYTKYCHCCGELISDTMKYCPNCGSRIEDEI